MQSENWLEQIEKHKTALYSNGNSHGDKLANLKIIEEVLKNSKNKLNLSKKINVPKYFHYEPNVLFGKFYNGEDEKPISEFEWFQGVLKEVRKKGWEKFILRSNGEKEDSQNFFAPGAMESPIYDLSMNNDELQSIFESDNKVNQKILFNLRSNGEGWDYYEYFPMDFVSNIKQAINIGTSPQNNDTLEIMISKQGFDYKAKYLENAIMQDAISAKLTWDWPIDFSNNEIELENITENEFREQGVKKVPLDAVFQKILYDKKNNQKILESSSLYEVTTCSLSRFMLVNLRIWNKKEKFIEEQEIINIYNDLRKTIKKGYMELMDNIQDFDLSLNILEKNYLTLITEFQSKLNDIVPGVFENSRKINQDYVDIDYNDYEHIRRYGTNLVDKLVYGKLIYLSLVEGLKQLRNISSTNVIPDCVKTCILFEKTLESDVELEIINSNETFELVQIKPARSKGDYMESKGSEQDFRRAHRFFYATQEFGFDYRKNDYFHNESLLMLNYATAKAIAPSQTVFQGEIKNISKTQNIFKHVIELKGKVGDDTEKSNYQVLLAQEPPQSGSMSNHGSSSVRYELPKDILGLIISPFLNEIIKQRIDKGEKTQLHSDGARCILY